MEDKQDSKVHENDVPVKLPYAKPELTELGNVVEITKGGGGGGDGFGGGRS